MQQSQSIAINTSPLKIKDILPKQTNEQTEQTNEQTNEQTEQIEDAKETRELIIKDVPKSVLENIENTEEKRRMINLIQKYQDSSRFGKIVKYELGFKQNFIELSEKSETELDNILQRIRIHLDNKNLDKFYENMATTVAITYEQVLSPFYPIDGFSDLLLDNDDFWNSYERFRIESEFPSVNPTTQMLFMIAQLTVIAHHTRGSYEESEPYEMQPPKQSLETIIEEIENPQTLETKTNETKPNEIEINKPPEPLLLGQKL